ncbi:patatin [Nitrincola sp. A-D6]|uniref:patatin-like phospholipase family protein n=1 Tax=Nitrincola sp. A-D6 TaxID=1545442 RepID=UPI00051FB313|nr:patatin-like phospholipase family protein [Nitrincola sp. A-D6]KGK42085.1 patatin [Nitrincola sp. A-D6]
MTVKTIELALQGGGSHGALTWGVLDRLLEESNLKIEGVSGTSAGAMNAVVLANGLESGSRQGARDALQTFWKSVSDAGKSSPIQRNLWAKITGDWGMESSPNYLLFDHLSRVFSPYEFNPLNLNPLRDLIVDLVDFEAVNRCKAVKVFVTATQVRNGRPKIFTQPNLSADALMASAALPFMFQAVEVDGEFYWDGGYSGNPALFPLVDECDARDMVLVQINPFERPDVPKTAREIIDRINEITFNSCLIKELRSVTLLRDLIEAEGLEKERYREMRLHRIHGDEDLQSLKASSKLNAEWEYLCYLRDMGRNRADVWLKEHWKDLGERATFDPQWLLKESVRDPDCKKGG